MSFVTIRAVNTWNAALPNRGGDGLPKTGIIGGETRQYISSQCQKRALRADQTLVRVLPDGAVAHDTLKALADKLRIGLSVRDPDVVERLLGPVVVERGFNEPEMWTKAIASLYRKAAAQKTDDDQDAEDDERAIPIVLGRREITALADLIEVAIADGLTPDDLLDSKKAKAARKKLKTLSLGIAALADPASAGMDGALFGRFASSELVLTIDGCAHVGHAYTTHPLQSWADFFSATADLREEPGAGHINTQPLTSGTFYRFMVVDLAQMRRNLGSVADSNQQAALVAWLIRAFARAQPAAKRGSTAPYSLPYEVIAEIGTGTPFAGEPFDNIKPRTAADARRQLLGYLEEADQLYGAPAVRLVMRDMAEEGAKQPALDRLADRVEQELATLGERREAA